MTEPDYETRAGVMLFSMWLGGLIMYVTTLVGNEFLTGVVIGALIMCAVFGWWLTG